MAHGAMPDKTTFQQALLSWYEKVKRDLPWRKTKDPYKIWVSEVMLQQTRVETVIPYYQRFLEQFPTLQDLAAADESEVLKAWEGLGYYARARHLHAGVREVAASYGGKVPDSPEEMRRIKGVGPYTAGAVLSIAYGIPVPAVDGNVMRVFSRLFCLEEDITRQSARRQIEQLVQELMYEEDPSSFNQALMELGATVCTPRSPGCLLCPLVKMCQAYARGMQEELPRKKRPNPPRLVQPLVGVVQAQGQVLVKQRPEEGLLAGLWEFPWTEWTGSAALRQEDRQAAADTLKRWLYLETGLRLSGGRRWMRMRHLFTHLKWEGEVYLFQADEAGEQLPEDYRWVAAEELDELAFSKAHRLILDKLLAIVKGVDQDIDGKMGG